MTIDLTYNPEDGHHGNISPKAKTREILGESSVQPGFLAFAFNSHHQSPIVTDKKVKALQYGSHG